MDTTSGFRFDTTLENLPFLLEGLKWTLVVSFAGLALGSAIGLAIALLRLIKNRLLNALALTAVNVFQSTPLLVQLLWLFFALPILTGWSISPLMAGIIGLGLYSGAYLSEVFRAGVLAVRSGQWQAGRALGMSTPLLLRRIIVPQAVAYVLPPMATVWVATIKESALVSAVAVEELTHRAATLASVTFRPVEALTMAALLYFVVLYPFVLFSNALHRRLVRH